MLAPVPWWQRWTAVLAAVVTPILFVAFIAIARKVVDSFVGDTLLGFVAPLWFVAIGLFAFYTVAPSLPGWVRAIVVVTFMQALLLGFVLVLWELLSSAPRVGEAIPLALEVPVLPSVVAVGGAMLAAAAVHAGFRRRRGIPGWLEAAVAFLQANLLTLGLTIPTIAVIWPAGESEPTLPGVQVVVGPAAILAVIGLVMVREQVGLWRGIVGAWLGLVLLGMLLMPAHRLWVYSNFAHLLLGNAILALLAVVLLALLHWRAVRVARRDLGQPAPWVQEGVVEAATPEPVAVIGAPGWLQPLELELRPFRLATDRGSLEVPATSRLVGLPLWSLFLAPGTRTALLQPGDALRASGYVAADRQGDAGPFRRSALPLAGPDGLVLSELAADGASPAGNAILAVWRPCLLYLLTATVVSLPALLGLLAWWTDRP